jgi:tetratricopeptide (TPR) repeat protein
VRLHLHLEHSNGTLLKGAEGTDDDRLKGVKGGDGTRLKGVDTTAQGNALGIPGRPAQALKGRNSECPTKVNLWRGLEGWVRRGASGFALSGLRRIWRPYSPGVALGYCLSAFQAVGPESSKVHARYRGLKRFLPGACSLQSARALAQSKTLRTLGRFGIRCVGVGVLFLALLAIASTPLSSRAAPSEGAFESANKLYEEGKFAEAASAYEKLVQSGEVSAALYFNLGNAWFKSGQIGRAIAAYREAQQIAPRDPDLRANLQFARNQTPSPTLPPSRWQRWLGRLTLNEWTLLATGAVWLWLVLMAILQWRPTLRPVLRGYAISLAVLAALLCACTAAALREARFTCTAIVVTREATVRYGPLAESPAAFTVHDGAELRVLDQKDEWLQVNAGPRSVGWLRRDQTFLP